MPIPLLLTPADNLTLFLALNSTLSVTIVDYRETALLPS